MRCALKNKKRAVVSPTSVVPVAPCPMFDTNASSPSVPMSCPSAPKDALICNWLLADVGPDMLVVLVVLFSFV